MTQGVALVFISVLSIRYGNDNLHLALGLFLLVISGIATAAWFLSERVSPVEEAYQLGYQAGYHDGRRAESLTVVPMQRAS